MKNGWRGIYSLHTKSNRYTQFTKLGGTDSTDSVGPKRELYLNLSLLLVEVYWCQHALDRDVGKCHYGQGY